MKEKFERKIEWIKENNNIWKFTRPIFQPYSTPFRGLTLQNEKITEPKKIVEVRADHYEEHFSEPLPNSNNNFHNECLSIYEKISSLTNIPLENISIEEVKKEWSKFKPKKSTDSSDISAFLLKNLPSQYLNIITILFNRRSSNGEFFLASKHAKIVCLPKEGIYPSPNRLRPISLLPNIGKCLERIIHNRILRWCRDMNINTDEQSGFSSSRRIQTRIISLIEELRLTVAANNRPALTIFVDFLSAFDNVWIPALIRNLYVMEMPLPLLKWISNWLKDRSFSIHFGSEKLRTIPMKRGVPQGSVLAATLIRLYIHFLPDQLSGCITHLFADDMVMVLNGSLEKKFSTNILEVEAKADIFLNKLEKFSDDMILPVNVSKTKAMLIHNIVAPPYPQIRFKNIPIEFVKCYKYLGVNISVKLGWEKYVNERLKTIRNIYNALRIIYKTIKMNNIKIRRKIFLAYVLPHFIWIFCIWFFLSERLLFWTTPGI